MRHSPNLALTIAALLAGAPCRPAEPSEDPYWHLKQERMEAYRMGDRAYFEQVLAPEFETLDAAGRHLDKAQYLDAEFGPGQREVLASRTRVSDFKATRAGDTLLLTYKEEVASTVGESAFVERLARLDVYVLRNGAWKLLAMTAVHRPETPPAIALDSGALAAFAGRYAFSPTMISVVTLESGKLYEQSSGQARVELIPVGKDLFYSPPDLEARIAFERDGQGHVVAQVYRSGNQALKGERLP